MCLCALTIWPLSDAGETGSCFHVRRPPQTAGVSLVVQGKGHTGGLRHPMTRYNLQLQYMAIAWQWIGAESVIHSYLNSTTSVVTLRAPLIREPVLLSPKESISKLYNIFRRTLSISCLLETLVHAACWSKAQSGDLCPPKLQSHKLSCSKNVDKTNRYPLA